MPWLPSAGILLVVFCVGALPTNQYWKVGAAESACLPRLPRGLLAGASGACLLPPNCWTLPPCMQVGAYFGVLLLFYLLYSLPMSYIKHNRVDQAHDGLK